jgi:curved DNA-binding protein CbpA
MQDLYAILGVGRNSSNAAIKAAYRELAKQSHPDLHVGDGEAEDRTKEINSAYTILGDPESRAAYDGKLALAAARERRTAFVNNAAIAAGIAFFAILAGAVTFTVTRMQSSRPHFASELVRPAAGSRIATIGVPETAAAHSGIPASEAARPGSAPEERRVAAAEQNVAPVKDTEHAALVPVARPEIAAAPSVAAAKQAERARLIETAKAGTQQNSKPATADAPMVALAAEAILKTAAVPKHRTAHRGRAVARKARKRSGARTRALEAEGFLPSRERQESEPGWIPSRKTMARRGPGADGPWGEIEDRTE